MRSNLKGADKMQRIAVREVETIRKHDEQCINCGYISHAGDRVQRSMFTNRVAKCENCEVELCQA